MTLLGTIRADLLVGTAWKQVGTQDGAPFTTYWLQLQNGRGETFAIHANQTPELLSVLGQALKCVRETAPRFTIKPEVRGPQSPQKQS